jgi:hypothetical protein
VLDEKGMGVFYVWLGDAQFYTFTKHTFLNLCDFAEGHGAVRMVFLLDQDHAEIKEYQRMFKVLDAVQMSDGSVKDLVRSDIASSDQDECDFSPGSNSTKSQRVSDKMAFYRYEL